MRFLTSKKISVLATDWYSAFSDLFASLINQQMNISSQWQMWICSKSFYFCCFFRWLRQIQIQLNLSEKSRITFSDISHLIIFLHIRPIQLQFKSQWKKWTLIVLKSLNVKIHLMTKSFQLFGKALSTTSFIGYDCGKFKLVWESKITSNHISQNDIPPYIWIQLQSRL